MLMCPNIKAPITFKSPISFWICCYETYQVTLNRWLSAPGKDFCLSFSFLFLLLPFSFFSFFSLFFLIRSWGVVDQTWLEHSHTTWYAVAYKGLPTTAMRPDIGNGSVKFIGYDGFVHRGKSKADSMYLCFRRRAQKALLVPVLSTW